ncbi:MAG: hypothetical protein V4691_09500 [Pseudomonadota bacterium]
MTNIAFLKQLAGLDGNDVLEATTVWQKLSDFDFIGRGRNSKFSKRKDDFLETSNTSEKIKKEKGIEVKISELDAASQAFDIPLARFLKSGNPYLKNGEQMDYLTFQILKTAQRNGINVDFEGIDKKYQK